MWHDMNVWNVDFIKAFDCLDVEELGKLEMKFLNIVHFNVAVSRSECESLTFF